METMGRNESTLLTQLVELTSDAVAICDAAGTVLHVNRQLVAISKMSRDALVGRDIKDLIFSESFERASDHRLPFALDGSDCTLMLKLADGSFIPVLARAIALSPLRTDERSSFIKRLLPKGRVLVVMRSLEEQYAHNRQMQRVLSELQAANKRLSGTLSVIMSTVGAEDLPSLLDSVLNRLVDALDADGATIYFSESGGFRLRGASHGLEHDYVPEFIPYGAGIPTYVLRQSRSCRFSVVPAGEGPGYESGSFYDLDVRRSHKLRVQDMPPFKTLIDVPVFFGTQVMGVLELGWKRFTMPRSSDVNVLEVICDYLSIELVSLSTALRSRRTTELNRSLNHLRDMLYAFEDDQTVAWNELTGEVRRVLACHVCPVVYDERSGGYLIDYEGGSQVMLPADIDSLFFSTTAPAARVGASLRDRFTTPLGRSSSTEDELKAFRLTRVDRTSRAGEWLYSHGLPNQGVFLDLRRRPANPQEMRPVEPASEEEGLVLFDTSRPPMMLLLLRDSSQEPIDDAEFDYLVRLTHDVELFAQNMVRRKETTHIAQTLQIGMRNSLGTVPGIISDSLYSSATQQALVGGDFYTLIRLPDDHAVMILGDVSGKGIEAASMSALVKTALSAYAWEGTSPVQMVRSLNAMLMSFSRVETFATMFVANIDLRSRSALYCSAGHPPTMLIHPLADDPAHDGAHAGEIELLSTQSGVVGAFEDMTFRSGSFTFDPGDILFMYTDGAIEARNAQGEFFGEQRLRDILLSQAGHGVEGLCERVLDELDRFTDSSLEDDIAMVALRLDCQGVE
ncbi:SpoIIE family protein phosphatase [Collinsella sp. An2]|uniref:SpoIIE family protein phosphatase n=1 Tax=Collinsella sp. An2 TaxID=1965585 RepID=UPI000B3A3614|nr:SpoIIE family protein phosphatase [Collinsella sp. An2]OUP08021.1 protein serine phosphatase [Collinsella sp. An2]